MFNVFQSSQGRLDVPEHALLLQLAQDQLCDLELVHVDLDEPAQRLGGHQEGDAPAAGRIRGRAVCLG